jgi:putative lipoprotein
VAETYGFDCGDQRTLVARIDGDFAYLVSEGYSALPRLDDPEATSADAPRTYGLGMERVSLTGAHAIVTLADGSKLECARDPELSTWADAQLRGVSFRAVGSEPRFVLEVGPEAVTVVTDDGARTYSIPRPEPQRTGDETVYLGGSGEERIVATIEPGVCNVGEQSFQNHVRLEVGDRTYEGCGRAIEAPQASVATFRDERAEGLK